MAIGSITQTGTGNDNRERNFSPNGYTSTVDTDATLEQIRTANSISISLEFFEIYLSPQNAVRGDLRKNFGNLTPNSYATVSSESSSHSHVSLAT
ncbi:hypothetical protein VF21_02220 [Pseudogymnoascus sp. 05NY08]|nr:hypothetical protein VF21_02220 [Pseudogymnoascus sp. 05NY08]